MNAKTFADGLKELATKKRSKNKATIGSQGGWYVYEEREERGGKAGKGRLSPSLSLSLSLSLMAPSPSVSSFSRPCSPRAQHLCDL